MTYKLSRKYFLTNNDEKQFSFRIPITESGCNRCFIYYLHGKTGFFDITARCIQLHTPESCLKETGFSGLSVIVHRIDIRSATADMQLLDLAQSLHLPVISEDRKILMSASRNGITFYNSLMILNFLLYNKSIGTGKFMVFLKQLTGIARYSEKVLLFGKEITRMILGEMN